MKSYTLITAVTQIEPSLTGDMKVTTTNGLFFIPERIGAFTVIHGTLSKSFNEKSSVAISVEGNRILTVYYPTRDLVWRVADDKTNPNRMVVSLQMRPTLAYLNKMAPDFNEVLNALHRAKDSKQNYLIAINPANQFIEAIKSME